MQKTGEMYTKFTAKLFQKAQERFIKEHIRWVYLDQYPSQIANSPTVSYTEMGDDYNGDNPRAARLFDTNADMMKDLIYFIDGVGYVKKCRKNGTFAPATELSKDQN